MLYVDHGAIVARRSKTPLNMMVTLLGTRELPDAQVKRFLSRKISHINQVLRRHQHERLGITVYERLPWSSLHAHYLVHVPTRCVRDEIIRLADKWNATEPGVIAIEKANEGAADYVTKQRQCLPPEAEDWAALHRRKRQRGEWIDGPRLSITTSLKLMAARR
ncbi:hypothetical protein [Microvirga antarctica]|uniref:hypothetical protein n=1 Tax=Microvirga antarctica TaxID=2819233 RepID=UPI001B3164F6|nr:hypothetical protein [Microvirga antarctica]